MQKPFILRIVLQFTRQNYLIFVYVLYCTNLIITTLLHIIYHQGELESILSQRFDRKIRIVGSGRTDTGVHARGQAMHFDLEDELPLDEDKKLEYCINSMLRRDVRVWNVGIAPESLLVTDEQGNVLQHKWHAIVSSKSKLYSYRFATTHYLDPIDRHYRSHFYESFNINQFQKLMQEYVGTRNFRAFAGAIEANEKRKGKAIGTVRTVTKIDLITEGEGKYRLDIYLEGALYKMVRNMVGTVLAVCTGKIDEETFMSFVHQPLDEDTSERVYARDDNLAKPAPPQGLTLECVFFDDHDDF